MMENLNEKRFGVKDILMPPQQHLPRLPVESRKEVKQFLLCVNLHDMIGAFESIKFKPPHPSPLPRKRGRGQKYFN